MINDLLLLAARVVELERKLASGQRQGVVSHVDPAQGLVRLDLGDDMLSPWVPYVQTAGALKVHSPPSVGQLMTLLAPSGETSQGFAAPLSFGGGNDPPSTAGDAHVITFGDVRLEIISGGVTLSVGAVTMEITAGGLAVTGGSLTHNGTNIGDTHRHGGVVSGASSTDVPE